MTNIFLMDSLKFALEVNKININSYVPAYNGESAGLDLFNAGREFYWWWAFHQWFFGNRQSQPLPGLFERGSSWWWVLHQLEHEVYGPRSLLDPCQ